MAIANDLRPSAEKIPAPQSADAQSIGERRAFLRAGLAAFTFGGLGTSKIFAGDDPGQSSNGGEQGTEGRIVRTAARGSSVTSSWLNPSAETIPVDIAMTRTAEARPVQGSPGATPAALPRDLAEITQHRGITIEYQGYVHNKPNAASYRLVASNGQKIRVEVETPTSPDFWEKYRDEKLARTLAVETGLRQNLDFSAGAKRFHFTYVSSQNDVAKSFPEAALPPQVPAGSQLILRGRPVDLTTALRQGLSPLTIELNAARTHIRYANLEGGATNGQPNLAVIMEVPKGDPQRWLLERDSKIINMLVDAGTLRVPAELARR